MNYQQAVENLRPQYDSNAEQRDMGNKSAWKISERAHFLHYLQRFPTTNEPLRLLEVGAGTGQDAVFFRDQGIQVVCSDVSPVMVARCREKGLTAYTADFLSLPFEPASFEAIYALNCLLHVPKADLPRVLQALRALLVPRGLFYLGVYGGENREGLFGTGDEGEEAGRFFSYYTADSLIAAVTPFFELLYFRAIDLELNPATQALGRACFQSLILQVR